MTALDTTPAKPKIEGFTEQTEIRTMQDTFRRLLCQTIWRISCPCHRGGEYAIAVVPSWDAALDIALLHGRTFHGDT